MNLVIATILALLLSPISLVLAGVSLGFSVIVIAYVGYLIPGTPYLTRHLLPKSILARFGKTPLESVATDGSEIDWLVATNFLKEVNGTLSLSSSFTDAWANQIEALRNNKCAQQLAFGSMINTDPDTVSFEEINSTGAIAVHIEGNPVSQWISAAALLADIAANEVLSSVDPEWTELPVQARHPMLIGLRQFCSQCPACDGNLTSREEATASCCWSPHTITARCDNCGERLYLIAAHSQ